MTSGREREERQVNMRIKALLDKLGHAEPFHALRKPESSV